MKSYGQYCPVAQALEVLGERWTLLIARELLYGAKRFGEILNGVPRMPRSMLAARLQGLEREGLIVRRANDGNVEYEPTPALLALGDVIVGLGLWARKWAHRGFKDEELDPALLLWDMQRRLDTPRLPPDLVVIRFDFSDDKRGFSHYWLKIEDGRGEVCIIHPGFEEKVVVRTTTRTLVEIWMGYTAFADAIRDGRVQMEGPTDLVRALPTWFKLHLLVEVERTQATHS